MKPFSLFCALATGFLMISGCMVGPNFHPPQTTVPGSWEGAKKIEQDQTSVAIAQPADLVDWWSRFNDPMLTSLVQRAIASNLDLAQAKARIRQARAARGVVAAGLWPQVGTSGSYQRVGTGGGQVSGGGGTESDLYQAGLDASWEIDIFGGVRREIEASTADIQTAIEDRRDLLVSLVAEVGASYIDLRGLQEEIAIARKNLKAQQHTVEITQKRFEAGFVSALDVANASAQAATTDSQIPVLESSEQATIYSLGVLLGREPTALAEELSPQGAIPLTPPQVPVGLPSDLLRRRPDIRRAETQLHAATARIGVATANLFPKFSLTGSLGFSSTDLTSLTRWSSSAWSYGPGVSWPLFDAGKIRSSIEVQNAVQEQALLQYRQTVLTALQDVETALVAYAKEQQHWKALREAVTQNRKAVDLSMKLYVAGRTDFLNVLASQNALYSSETALTQSSATMATNLVAVYKALGGGWEDQS